MPLTDREAMKQALEALEEINKLSIGEHAICLPAEIDGAMDALRGRLAQPEPDDGLSWLKKDSNYFSQPKRKPLTDEEIRHFWREATMKPKYTSEFVEDFARAIESAHGIKGEA